MANAPAGSLQAAIDAADGRVTVLDDKQDLENAAIYSWLSAHQLHKGRLNHLVIGEDVLPAGWAGEAITFSSAADAGSRLAAARKDPTALAALRKLAHRPGSTLPPKAPDKDVLDNVALALFSGDLWAISPKKHASRFVGKTSPGVLPPLNAKHGTAIDFAYIASLEGDQWLRGYVPFGKGGIVAGKSGLTVATGFDVGQWSDAQIKGMSFPADLQAKLTPFTQTNMDAKLTSADGHIDKKAFKGMNKTKVAAAVAKLGAVPVLTKPEADLCDGVVFDTILTEAIRAYNAGRDRKATPEFKGLPTAWQTVWLSRNFQEGGASPYVQGRLFRKEAMAGHWDAAIAALRSYTEYGSRVKSEADKLAADMPPPPPPTAAAPGAKPPLPLKPKP